MEPVKVFCYGALCFEKLTSVVGDVRVVGGAILPRHRLRFGGTSKMYGGSSVATAVPQTHDQDKYNVMGMVYEVQEAQMELLDLFMECSLGLMKRVRGTVHTGKGSLDVYMYVLQKRHQIHQHQCRPSPLYANLHMTLAREGYDSYRTQNYSHS